MDASAQCEWKSSRGGVCGARWLRVLAFLRWAGMAIKGRHQPSSCHMGRGMLPFAPAVAKSVLRQLVSFVKRQGAAHVAQAYYKIAHGVD